MIGGRGGGSLVAIAFLALTQLQVVTARANLLVTNNVGSAPGNVLQFDQTTGAFERVFIPNAGSQPIDIALGPDGNLYVTSGLTSSTGNPAMLFSIRRFDARTGAEMIALFERLNADGTTIVVVTHDEELARAAKRVVHMRDGEIVG